MIFSLLSGGEWWGLLAMLKVAVIQKNQAKRRDYCPIFLTKKLSAVPSSGKTRDFPDKLAQHQAVIRKNTRFPGQTAMFVSCLFNKIIKQNLRTRLMKIFTNC
jgi:hypothetical protein